MKITLFLGTFFADMIFSRFKHPEHVPRNILSGVAHVAKNISHMGGGVGINIGSHFRSVVNKELQSIQISEIKDALMNENKSEKSELF